MYNQVFNLHAQILKAMAHPKRLEIIHLLRDQEMCVSEIQEMLGLPQANLSQHLQILREANLLNYSKSGKNIFYCLKHPNIIKASDLIRDLLIDQCQNEQLADELTMSMKDLVPLVIDPVCGMRVSPKTASVGAQYEGQKFYFCATGCYEKFIKNPQAYVHQK